MKVRVMKLWLLDMMLSDGPESDFRIEPSKCLCLCLPRLSTVTRGVTSRSRGVLNGYPAAAHTKQLSSRSCSTEDWAPCISTELLMGQTLSEQSVYVCSGTHADMFTPQLTRTPSQRTHTHTHNETPAGKQAASLTVLKKPERTHMHKNRQC